MIKQCLAIAISAATGVVIGGFVWWICLEPFFAPVPCELPDGVLRVASSKDVESLQKRLDCIETGGHKWELKEIEQGKWYPPSKDYWLNCLDRKWYKSRDEFLFKCSHCGKEVKKTEDELMDEERQALISLGVIE